MIKKTSKYLMGLFYILAGVMHFINPEFYMKIMPPYLPWHLALVYISGLVEIGLGVALLIPKTSRISAWGIILLLVAVFPANFYQFTSGGAGMDVPKWALVTRLCFQVVLIGWAYVYTKGNTTDRNETLN